MTRIQNLKIQISPQWGFGVLGFWGAIVRFYADIRSVSIAKFILKK